MTKTVRQLSQIFTFGCCFLLSGVISTVGQTNAPTDQPTKEAVLQSSTNTLSRVHAYVSGKVQGVGFRNFTQQTATSLQLNGWVKNLADGRVELVAEGSVTNLKKLLEAVAIGPDGAKVDKIEQKEEIYRAEFKGFSVER